MHAGGKKKVGGEKKFGGGRKDSCVPTPIRGKYSSGWEKRLGINGGWGEDVSRSSAAHGYHT